MEILDKERMRTLDRKAIELVGVERLMESAGKSIAHVYEKEIGKKRIGVIAGKGNNGGDALCAARYLKNKGYDVKVVLVGEGNENVKEQLRFGRFEVVEKEELKGVDAIIDGIFGYNFRGKAEGEYKEIIEYVNELGKEVLVVDLPSGIDADKGKEEVAIKAKVTVCLGALKKGLFLENARENVGKIVVVDIGIPDWIYREEGLEVWFGEVEGTKSNKKKKPIFEPERVREKREHRYFVEKNIYKDIKEGLKNSLLDINKHIINTYLHKYMEYLSNKDGLYLYELPVIKSFLAIAFEGSVKTYLALKETDKFFKIEERNRSLGKLKEIIPKKILDSVKEEYEYVREVRNETLHFSFSFLSLPYEEHYILFTIKYFLVKAGIYNSLDSEVKSFIEKKIEYIQDIKISTINELLAKELVKCKTDR